ncbi:hypothetical protein BGZ73_006154 [Actinomortierella ambigua]|nr:hypothetical protein BGZ73_006154 [Actinomortierella ambigua]
MHFTYLETFEPHQVMHSFTDDSTLDFSPVPPTSAEIKGKARAETFVDADVGNPPSFHAAIPKRISSRSANSTTRCSETPTAAFYSSPCSSSSALDSSSNMTESMLSTPASDSVVSEATLPSLHSSSSSFSYLRKTSSTDGTALLTPNPTTVVSSSKGYRKLFHSKKSDRSTATIAETNLIDESPSLVNPITSTLTPVETAHRKRTKRRFLKSWRLPFRNSRNNCDATTFDLDDDDEEAMIIPELPSSARLRYSKSLPDISCRGKAKKSLAQLLSPGLAWRSLSSCEPHYVAATTPSALDTDDDDDSDNLYNGDDAHGKTLLPAYTGRRLTRSDGETELSTILDTADTITGTREHDQRGNDDDSPMYTSFSSMTETVHGTTPPSSSLPRSPSFVHDAILQPWVNDARFLMEPFLCPATPLTRYETVALRVERGYLFFRPGSPANAGDACGPCLDPADSSDAPFHHRGVLGSHHQHRY